MKFKLFTSMLIIFLIVSATLAFAESKGEVKMLVMSGPEADYVKSAAEYYRGV